MERALLPASSRFLLRPVQLRTLHARDGFSAWRPSLLGYTGAMELGALFEKNLAYEPGAALDELPTSGGVYLLTDADNTPIQLATTADLKRALRHRLSGEASADAPAAVSDGGSETEMVATPSAPTPRRPRVNLAEIVRRIWWRPAGSQFELTYAYYQLARILIPQTYRKQLSFGPAWFVHVDVDAPFPRFVAGKYLRGSPGVDLGPMATQNDASRLVEILQDTFDLCRYHHILEQAPFGQACAYFEMGKCPAPCDGTVTMDRYRGLIGDALRFATGEHAPMYAAIESQMRDAARDQAYERAGLLKKRLERARAIEHASLSRVEPVELLRYLVVQRGGGTRVRPFFVRGGSVEMGEEVKRAQWREAAGRWTQRLMEAPAGEVPDLETRSEQLWLVSHFLFKPDRPGLYLNAREIGSGEALHERMLAAFPAPPKGTSQAAVPETGASEGV